MSEFSVMSDVDNRLSSSDRIGCEELPLDLEVIEDIAQRVVAIEKESIDAQLTHGQTISKIYDMLRDQVRAEINKGVV